MVNKEVADAINEVHTLWTRMTDDMRQGWRVGHPALRKLAVAMESMDGEKELQ